MARQMTVRPVESGPCAWHRGFAQEMVRQLDDLWPGEQAPEQYERECPLAGGKSEACACGSKPAPAGWRA